MDGAKEAIVFRRTHFAWKVIVTEKEAQGLLHEMNATIPVCD